MMRVTKLSVHIKVSFSSGCLMVFFVFTCCISNYLKGIWVNNRNLLWWWTWFFTLRLFLFITFFSFFFVSISSFPNLVFRSLFPGRSAASMLALRSLMSSNSFCSSSCSSSSASSAIQMSPSTGNRVPPCSVAPVKPDPVNPQTLGNMTRPVSVRARNLEHVSPSKWEKPYLYLETTDRLGHDRI